MTDLLAVEEAQRRIVAAFKPVAETSVPLGQANGHVLSQDISAAQDLPAFTSSTMDGFAVRSTEVAGASRDHPVTLKLAGDIPAGSPLAGQIGEGQAARIMTGAVLPVGADAVVPVEDTDAYQRMDRGLPGSVTIFASRKPGEFTRPRGQDVRAGQVVLAKSHRLLPQDLGMLATLGIASVPVYGKPKVALFSSGDELVEPGNPLGPGQIYDSNSFTLAALAQKYGAEMLPLGVVRDDPLLVTERLQAAVRLGADLILTSAGVSVGTFDYVRAILEENGSLSFWRVNVRPGKPLAFGSYQNTPVIGLPGNPVSAFVGFLLFVVPAIQRLSGLPDTRPARVRAVLAEPVESDGRESYLRAVTWREDGMTRVKLAGGQGSANLYTLVQANALLIVPSGVKSLPVGQEAELILLGADIE